MTKFTENFVVTDTKHCSIETDSDNFVEFETNEKAQQDAYKNMYAQWLRVVDENHALVSENAFLINFKDKSKEKVQVLKRFVVEKGDGIKDISTELERPQKNLKMLNSGSEQLDQILSKSKFIGNQEGLGFKGE